MFETSTECFMGNFTTLLVLMGGLFFYIIGSIVYSAIFGSKETSPKPVEKTVTSPGHKWTTLNHHGLLRKNA